jgi:hypothetical protein
MKPIYFVILIVIAGCGYNNTKVPGETSSSQQNQGTTGALDFKSVSGLVFQNFCIRCHSQAGGNKGGINLETYASVKSITPKILAAVSGGVMPPTGTLSSSAKNILISWIQAGAPEVSTGGANPNTPNPVPQPGPTPVPCEDHLDLIEHGLISDLDKNLYFDFQTETVKRRHDDCP